MKKTFLAIALATNMLAIACNKEDQQPEELLHIVRTESDTHGFAPTGNTEIKGLFTHDTVMHSTALLARTINTVTYSDGHIETDTLPYEFTLEMGGKYAFYAAEVQYASDSANAYGNGMFYDKENQDNKYIGQFTLNLKENGAPLEAQATINYLDRTVELHFTR